MTSEEMYLILSNIPLPTEAIAYEELWKRVSTQGMSQNKFIHLLNQARNKCFHYIFVFGDLEDATISLTEKGVSEIQEYERMMENQRIVRESLLATQESLKIAQKSLKVAQIAKGAAIFSAVAAALALIPQIPDLCAFFSSIVCFFRNSIT